MAVPQNYMDALLRKGVEGMDDQQIANFLQNWKTGKFSQEQQAQLKDLRAAIDGPSEPLPQSQTSFVSDSLQSVIDQYGPVNTPEDRELGLFFDPDDAYSYESADQRRAQRREQLARYAETGGPSTRIGNAGGAGPATIPGEPLGPLPDTGDGAGGGAGGGGNGGAPFDPGSPGNYTPGDGGGYEWNWDAFQRPGGTDIGGFGAYDENYDVSRRYSPGEDAWWGSENFPGDNRDFYQNQFGNLLGQEQNFQKAQRQAATIRSEMAENPQQAAPLDWSWLEGGLPEVEVMQNGYAAPMPGQGMDTGDYGYQEGGAAFQFNPAQAAWLATVGGGNF